MPRIGDDRRIVNPEGRTSSVRDAKAVLGEQLLERLVDLGHLTLVPQLETSGLQPAVDKLAAQTDQSTDSRPSYEGTAPPGT